MSETRLAICSSSTGYIVFIGEDGEGLAALLLRFAKHLEEASVGYIGIELERHWDRTLTGHFWASFDTEPEATSVRYFTEVISVEEAVSVWQFDMGEEVA